MKNEKDKPIFYHSDDCDCIECLARCEKGGLDFDSTNDNEEYEKNEEEILKEKEGKIKFRKNQTIKFSYPSDLTGLPMILSGTVLGFGSAVRKKWPEEMGEADDSMMLVWRKDVYGNTFHHAVHPSEIVEDPVVDLKGKA